MSFAASSVVYAIRNKRTGRFYIGATAEPHRRFYEHCRCAWRGSPAPLYADMRRYGRIAFEFFVVSGGLDSCEREWLESYLVQEMHLAGAPLYNRNLRIRGRYWRMNERLKTLIAERTLELRRLA
jgi:hypothetical protein